MNQQRYEALLAENRKLKKALAEAIPWIGEPFEGPSWATPDAKARNRQMCENALDQACECFPEGYNSYQEMAKLN